MSRITFFTDAEMGHLQPTLDVAQELSSSGHTVSYISFPAAEAFVRTRGYRLDLIFDHVLPERKVRPVDAAEWDRLFDSIVLGSVMDRVLDKTNPHLMIIPTLMAWVGFAIRYKYRVPIVFVKTYCSTLTRVEECTRAFNDLQRQPSFLELQRILAKQGIVAKEPNAVALLASQIPEIILLPEEFAGESLDQRTCLAAPNLSCPAQREPPAFTNASNLKIYCCMGTQSSYVAEMSRRVYDATIQAVMNQQDWELIISTAGQFYQREFACDSPRIRILEWVQQRIVLRESDLMITHGGMGSIKDCVLSAVPMLVLPTTRDQFDAAKIVENEGLGLSTDVKTISAAKLRDLIQQIIQDQSFNKRLTLSSLKFRRHGFHSASKLIEQAATSQL